MAAQPPTDKPAWLDQSPTWLAAPPPGAAPEAPPLAPEPILTAPAWAAPQPKGSRLWIYLSGALLVAIVAGGGMFARAQIIAWQAANDQQIVLTSPTPFLSDYERADRFLNVELTPSLTGTLGPLQSVEKTCTPQTMTPGCHDGLIALDKAMSTTTDVISKGDIPVCIGREVLQFKNDWMGMEQGVAMAISGYAYNSHDLYLQGFVKFAEIAQYIQPDSDRITAAQKACSKLAR